MINIWPLGILCLCGRRVDFYLLDEGYSIPTVEELWSFLTIAGYLASTSVCEPSADVRRGSGGKEKFFSAIAWFNNKRTTDSLTLGFSKIFLTPCRRRGGLNSSGGGIFLIKYNLYNT